MSITYYLTLFVIKLKRLKKKFSQDPINYKSIRKEDVFHPKGVFFRKNITKTFQVLKTQVTEVTCNNEPKKLLLFIHGGAFISGPGQHHWDTIKAIAKETDYAIWMCNYPKAPEHGISELSENIDATYHEALKQYQSSDIVCMGDSVGGTLIAALVQRLIANEYVLPSKLLLVCPVMDSSLTNVDIEKVDEVDPMLSKKGVLSAKRMCARNEDLKSAIISPLYGSFEKFPKTILYAAEYDITYPDQLLAFEKAKKANMDIELVVGEKMPHIWPFLPIMKEAQFTLHSMIDVLNES